jgi:hypothetical protein
VLFKGNHIIYDRLEAMFNAGSSASMLIWLFFVNLWVAIEGVCLIYAIRIKRAVNAKLSIKQLRRPLKTAIFQWLVTTTFIVLIFGTYILFNLVALKYYSKNIIAEDNLFNLYNFFLRFTSVEFIIIEWAIAVLVFKSFPLLKAVLKALPHE